MFRKKYWVNNINIGIETKYGQQIIGLYRGGRWKGTGNFSGWYAQEFRKGAVLLGYFIIESSASIRKGEKHIKNVMLEHPQRYKRLMINSLFTECEIIAQCDKEALELFFNEKWNDIKHI